ncbi:MAG: type II toxin-antitoxin system RelE/ParE family toxin [Deltaproteobacteria bacterium]|nr:type II toxin-antitoxin system RelE/ParE family toxin [Deltaproteobacteria bacterium]
MPRSTFCDDAKPGELLAYRILYEIDDQVKIVKIYRIAHRKEVYR